jgi:hypothetical protein
MRLRPQAARLAEEIGMGAETSVDGRVCAIAEPSRHRRLPLAAIVVPRPSRTQAKVVVERLRGRRAAAELLRSPRLPGWIEPSLMRLHFELSERLANAVPILEATIPWGPPFPRDLATELVGRILSNQ